MKILELRIPPVAVFLLFAGLMWLLDRLTPGFPVSGRLRITLTVLLLVVAGIIGMAGIRTFKRAQTTVNPLNPGAASSLVDDGIYRLSRNPMYLALLIALVAWGIGLANYYALSLPVVFVVYMTRFQIYPEERALEQLFGKEFLAYKKRVRRWI